MVKHDELSNTAPEIIAKDRYPQKPDNHYSPSKISGCELRVYLDRMLDIETTLNSWMFQGKAVHYYLQETNILTEALHQAGYHWVNTNYEISNVYEINDEAVISGTADVLARDVDDDTVVYDIKYSSIPPGSGHGRLYKYFTQAHIYAQIFDADGYGLIMIHSKADNLKDGIAVLEGKMSDENWEIIRDKVESIHVALKAAGFFDGNRWEAETIEEVGVGFWETVIEHFNTERIPTYQKECQYCDHAEYCPVKQDKLESGGVSEMIEETKG